MPALLVLERARHAALRHFADHAGKLGRGLVRRHVAKVAAIEPRGLVARSARRQHSEVSASFQLGSDLVDHLLRRRHDVAHPRFVFHLRLEQLDLRFVHLADGRLVDLFGGDMLDQDIAKDIVARGVEPVASLGVLVQAPLQGLHGKQLHFDQLIQDIIELGAAGLEVLSGLDDPLEPGLQLDVRDIDDLPVDGCRLGRHVAGDGFLCGMAVLPAGRKREAGRQGRHKCEPCPKCHPCKSHPEGPQAAKAVFGQSGLPSGLIDTGKGGPYVSPRRKSREFPLWFHGEICRGACLCKRGGYLSRSTLYVWDAAANSARAWLATERLNARDRH